MVMMFRWKFWAELQAWDMYQGGRRCFNGKMRHRKGEVMVSGKREAGVSIVEDVEVFM